MIKINVHKAKIQLSKMIDPVETGEEMGEEITIVRSGVAVAQMVPANQPAVRELGVDRERIFISPDFDAPLPPEINSAFLHDNQGEKEVDEC